MSEIPPDAPVPPGEPAPELPPAPGTQPAPGTGPTPAPTVAAPPPPRKRGAVVAFVVAVVLIVVAAGGAMAFFTFRGAPGAVLDKVPAGADVVFVAHLDPAASQKADLFRMTEKFPDLGSREELTQRFNEMVDQALGGTGYSHEDLDWIGGEAGGFADLGFGAPTFAVIVAVDDEGAAKAALQEIQARTGGSGSTSTTNISGIDVTIGADSSAWAVFDGVAVVTSDENSMRSVIDTANGAGSVEDDAVFSDVMDRLPQDNLGFVFLNMQEVLKLLGSIPAGVVPNMPSMAGLEGLQGIGYAASAEPDGLAIDAVVTTDPSKLTPEQRDALVAGGEPTPLLSRVPADAFAVLASRSAGGTTQGIGRSLDQLAAIDPEVARTIRQLHLTELLPHISGDVALDVGPGTGFLPVGATLMLGIDDRDAVSSWLDRYVPVLLAKAEMTAGADLKLTTQDHDGVTITSLAGGEIPTSFSWAVTDDSLIAGISPADVAEAIDLGNGSGDAIDADPGFRSATAKVPGLGTVFYVDVHAILGAVKGFLPPDQYQAFLDQGGKDIEPIEAIVAGSTGDEHATSLRLFIKIP